MSERSKEWGVQRKWSPSLTWLTGVVAAHSTQARSKGKSESKTEALFMEEVISRLCVSLLDVASADEVVTDVESIPLICVSWFLGLLRDGHLGRNHIIPKLTLLWFTFSSASFRSIGHQQFMEQFWPQSSCKDACEKAFHLRGTNSSIDFTNTLEVSVRAIKIVLGVEWGEGMA